MLRLLAPCLCPPTPLSLAVSLPRLLICAVLPREPASRPGAPTPPSALGCCCRHRPGRIWSGWPRCRSSSGRAARTSLACTPARAAANRRRGDLLRAAPPSPYRSPRALQSERRGRSVSAARCALAEDAAPPRAAVLLLWQQAAPRSALSAWRGSPQSSQRCAPAPPQARTIQKTAPGGPRRAVSHASLRCGSSTAAALLTRAS